MKKHESDKKNESEISFAQLAQENGSMPPESGSAPSRWKGAAESTGPETEPGLFAGSETGEPGMAADPRRILYEKAIAYLRKVFYAARSGSPFSVGEGIDIITRVADLVDEPDVLFVCALHIDYRVDYPIQHSVNTAIFSVKLGSDLGFTGDRLIEIGLCALLHDIGSVRVPAAIMGKASALTEKEMDAVHQRPRHSYEILSVFKNDHPCLPETAIQVYERVDGSGYPAGLQKDEITEYAQIIGLVDVYEALIHSRSHRSRFLHFNAVKEIIRTSKAKFSGHNLKKLINGFSIFPLHSVVRLNSGAVGRVTQTVPDQPLRPLLEILYDSQKRKVLMERTIDLADHPLLHIIDAVGDEELEKLAGNLK